MKSKFPRVLTINEGSSNNSEDRSVGNRFLLRDDPDGDSKVCAKTVSDPVTA
jgi:hypothetical protein